LAVIRVDVGISDDAILADHVPCLHWQDPANIAVEISTGPLIDRPSSPGAQPMPNATATSPRLSSRRGKLIGLVN
jgi:hypothetical protein